jgi:vacuolar protein sorting-associated protein 52
MSLFRLANYSRHCLFTGNRLVYSTILTYTMTESESSKDGLDKNLEDFEIQEVLRNGTDLREYALQVEKGIKEAEKTSIADYLKESENISSLHNQIEECDNILERMESMLMVFQVSIFLFV